jgi:hypothetical protein
MNLVWPGPEYLPGYLAALQKGWSSDNVRGKAAADEQLAMIASDSNAFLAGLIDREAEGKPIELPDGGNKAAATPRWRSGNCFPRPPRKVCDTSRSRPTPKT